jgi:hypothetical protein
LRSCRGIPLPSRSRCRHKIENANAAQTYRLDDATRRMRFRVLNIIFAAAVAIIIAMIVLDFVGH